MKYVLLSLTFIITALGSFAFGRQHPPQVAPLLHHPSTYYYGTGDRTADKLRFANKRLSVAHFTIQELEERLCVLHQQVYCEYLKP